MILSNQEPAKPRKARCWGGLKAGGYQGSGVMQTVLVPQQSLATLFPYA